MAQGKACAEKTETKVGLPGPEVGIGQLGTVLDEMPVGLEAFTRDVVFICKGVHQANRHLVLGECPCFVGTNDGGGPEGFDGFHSTDDRFVPGHVSHSERKRDDQDDGQPFGDNRHKDGDGDNELLHRNFPQVHTGFAVRDDEVQRNQQHSDDECYETQETTEALKFEFQGCFRGLSFGDVARNLSELCLHAGGDHQSEAATRGDRGAHERHVLAVCKHGLFGKGVGVFPNRQGLAREG